MKSCPQTHSLSQYWRMKKHREISIHYITFHTIRESRWTKPELRCRIRRCWVARQIMLQPYSQLHVFDTTKSNRLLTVEPRVLPINRHHTLSAQGSMDIPSDWPFYIVVSNFSHRKACTPKNMIIANTTAPPNAINTIESTDQKILAI